MCFEMALACVCLSRRANKKKKSKLFWKERQYFFEWYFSFVHFFCDIDVFRCSVIFNLITYDFRTKIAFELRKTRRTTMKIKCKNKKREENTTKLFCIFFLVLFAFFYRRKKISFCKIFNFSFRWQKVVNAAYILSYQKQKEHKNPFFRVARKVFYWKIEGQLFFDNNSLNGGWN